jgi:DNA excision repair protein ERCC-5
MGVTGLWTVLEPCARHIKLETLNRKRLAVDASIWIYQFLKAVRDKEGNALRNSHVVGFFRRICKLLFFGIKPVFVFDGGAPVLKRQTVLGRKRRREGRRDDAVRTAGKLFAMQMQRRLEDDKEKRMREKEIRGREVTPENEEEIPDPDQLVYVDEIGMSKQERQQTRKFYKTDAYHLPDLNGGIESMGQPNDPRIMTAEELEEYARQFDNGEDINLYDFSKIDFDGEFFKSLPAVDRYNILNAARLRSRLRMGLSKEQLEEMFPDRMAFSKFQIDRVRERNGLTQRLMNLNGMNDKNAMLGVGGGRIVGERGREYILVKNDGVEGGWALGVVSADKTLGERNKPIDVDAIARKRHEDEEWEDDDDFEDVPIEGLNRIPKIRDRPVTTGYDDSQVLEIAKQRRDLYASRQDAFLEESDSMFVAEEESRNGAFTRSIPISNNFEDLVYDDEEDDLNRAIAMSLENQHAQTSGSEAEEMNFEDIPMPAYEQKIAEEPKPVTGSSGQVIAHLVNNRANATIRKQREVSISSDDDMDLQAALALSRQQNVDFKKTQCARAPPNVKNQFDGPLPFPKLNFKLSLFSTKREGFTANPERQESDGEADLEGGFERDADEYAPRPLPPWIESARDIRSDVQQQLAKDIELNARDREMALQEERLFKNNRGIIEVGSSDNEGDIEVVDIHRLNQVIDLTGDNIQPLQPAFQEDETHAIGGVRERSSSNSQVRQPDIELSRRDGSCGANRREKSSENESIEWSESDREGTLLMSMNSTVLNQGTARKSESEPSTKTLSPLPINAICSGQTVNAGPATVNDRRLRTAMPKSPSPLLENVDIPVTVELERTETVPPADSEFDRKQADMVSDVDSNEFSYSSDEELFAQLTMEAEEHARFLSTFNNKSERENQEAYERELKALRNQQKKDRRDADEVSQTMIIECQALLRLFGIPYITAPMEAEAQCAELVRLSLVDGIVTDDSDIFLFGGNRVYKNMFTSNKDVECYLSSHVEKELSLTRHQLVSIAHLLGSDYTEGLPGIGPVTAVEIISEFPSPNGLEDFKTWWTETQTRPKDADTSTPFRKKFRRAQGTKLFLPPGFPSPSVTDAYMKPEVDSSSEPFQWGVPDLDNLRAFLMSTIGWSQERTDEVLVPVIRDMNRRATEGTQSNITRYFKGGVGIGEVGMARGVVNDAFVPQVREAGSKRMREAVRRLKAKKTPLTGTFADQAAEWAAKEAKRLEKEKQIGNRKGKGKGKGKGRGQKKCARDSENEGDDEFEGEKGAEIENAEVIDNDANSDEIVELEDRSERRDRGEKRRAEMNAKGKEKGKWKRAKISV